MYFFNVSRWLWPYFNKTKWCQKKSTGTHVEKIKCKTWHTLYGQYDLSFGFSTLFYGIVSQNIKTSNNPQTHLLNIHMVSMNAQHFSNLFWLWKMLCPIKCCKDWKQQRQIVHNSQHLFVYLMPLLLIPFGYIGFGFDAHANTCRKKLEKKYQIQ